MRGKKQDKPPRARVWVTLGLGEPDGYLLRIVQEPFADGILIQYHDIDKAREMLSVAANALDDRRYNVVATDDTENFDSPA